MGRVAEYSTLNANYLMAMLTKAGFDPAFPQRGPATNHHHPQAPAKTLGVTAMDFAKRLLDLGFHAPTPTFRCWCRNAC